MFMYYAGTIAAISTPPGMGGIGIIRISGDMAFEIASKIFKGRKPFDLIKSHTINYGKLINPQNGEVVDEVLLSKMQKPNTFTREDVVEINCHGGIAVLRQILEIVLEQGARPAEPGEFTKRAFLNGRIDLSQAEAVIDLINAKTCESSKAAANQLEGKLSIRIGEARKRLIGLIAHIEAAVDYPDEDIDELTGQKMYEELCKIREMLVKTVQSFEKGRILREGINAVIIGKPNVGKSSLLNELAGKNRAIVTDIPGTTRDIIEEYVNIRGVPVKITDTAGIRETEDMVERIGVEKAERAIEAADLIIMMVDASAGVNEEDLRILDKVKDKRAILLINKIDLVPENALKSIEEKLHGREFIKTSLKEEIGIPDIEREIEALFIKGDISFGSEVIVTNVRHKELLDESIENIDNAVNAYKSGIPLDLITIDIVNAAESLGGITGESVSEDVIHEIFSKFCVGK